MEKVYQSIVDKDKGDCMRAVIASLLEVELEDVPDFLNRNGWLKIMLDFLKEKTGHRFTPISLSYYSDEALFKILSDEEVDCFNGFFYASVPSRTYKDGSHAVIIDRDFIVVHDPNPNQLWLNENVKTVVEDLMIPFKYVIDLGGNLKEYGN